MPHRAKFLALVSRREASISVEVGPAERGSQGLAAHTIFKPEPSNFVMFDELIVSTSVFAAAFGVSAFAGLATLLRFSRKLSKLAVVSSMLNAGFLGLAISLIWYQNYQKAANIHGLIGMCVLAGMGGSTITDILISLLSGAGIKIIINHERDRDEVHRHSNNDDHGSTHP